MAPESPPTAERVREVLTSIPDPETGRPLNQQIRQTEVDADSIRVSIGLTSYAWPLKDRFQAHVADVLRRELGEVSQTLEVAIESHSRPAQPIGQIGLTAKATIAVAAGKGGVGKSSVATSLAMALHQMGCKTGLLDADVYGPSIPHLTGARGQVGKVDNRIQPMIVDGIPIMSVGFMVPPGEAVIWRGPMLHSAVTTMLRDTAWGDLDYLIIDMPPGTGDVALSLSQLLPLSGAVIVCTPQEVALIDAIKAVGMFRKVKIPVLGLIENMSRFVCPDNGKSYDIFGTGGAETYAREDNIRYLGDIPIHIDLRKRGDAGAMGQNLDDPEIGPRLRGIATELVQTLADRAAENPVQPQLPVLG